MLSLLLILFNSDQILYDTHGKKIKNCLKTKKKS